MILSASRRTDIPEYYSDWFINRLREGSVITRNPINPKQVSRIKITPEVVDCIVFWTKDPENILDKLKTIDNLGFRYYFQFTITPYDKTVEKRLRDKEEIIKTFCHLSGMIGKDKVLWRYDPIIINDMFDINYHTEQFKRLCAKLSRYTDQCTISFVDLYAKLKAPVIREISDDEMQELANKISSIAKEFGITVKACCEKTILLKCGIETASCIDRIIVEKICGYSLDIKRDKNQRNNCGCIESIDIGVYNTCKNGCIYCYANYSDSSVNNNCLRHNPKSEILLGNIDDNDKVLDRNYSSNKSNQLKLF